MILRFPQSWTWQTIDFVWFLWFFSKELYLVKSLSILDVGSDKIINWLGLNYFFRLRMLLEFLSFSQYLYYNRMSIYFLTPLKQSENTPQYFPQLFVWVHYNWHWYCSVGLIWRLAQLNYKWWFLPRWHCRWWRHLSTCLQQ